MEVFYENETDEDFEFDAEKLTGIVAEEVLSSVKCPFPAEINILITNAEGIQKANSEFRNIDKVTDVLSFPGIEFESPSDFGKLKSQETDCFDPETGNLMLGDIMINIGRVHSQAKEYGHSEKREFAFLVAHSMLHLCGYDHMQPDEAKVMEAKQEAALQKLGIKRG